MAYEIPQELEYKEKIIFNLTFSQLVYAIIFLPFLALILKSNLELSSKIFLSLIIIIFASLFMFFNLASKIKDSWYWLKSRKITLSMDVMKNLINIDKINEIAILKLNPINFSIMNDQEKEVTIKTFQKFLNSLEFGIQILVSTNDLELNEYYKRVNDKHIAHLNSIIKENKAMNRDFYLIIPKSNNHDLDIQVRICQERLTELNLISSRLNNKEIEQLLINFFSKDVVDKLEEDKSIDKKDYFYYKIAPKIIENYPDYLKINDKFNRIITANGYPRLVENGFLDKIITCKGDFNLSLFIEPFPIATTMITLNKELQKQRADLYALEKKGMINPSLDIKYKDTKKILEELQKGNEKLFNVSLYINCKADNKNDLDLLTKKVESELNSLLIIPKIPLFRMLQGLKSVTPLADNVLNIKRNITTEALSSFFPFTSQFLKIDEKGVLFGLNKNDIPIIKDVFNLKNANGIILATSGAGKSVTAKLLIMKHLMNNTKVMVIDPQSEYVNLVKEFNGELITISRDSETIINPLDLMEHDYAEKRLSLMDLFQVMLGNLSEIQKAVIDKALTLTYSKKGITNDPKTWNHEPPILKDLLNILESLSKNTTIIEKETYRSLINRLSMYVDGVFSFLNKQTKINFKNGFVCFNIGEMPKQVKPVVMFLILDYIYSKMKQDKERKILLVDEAWSLLSRVEDSNYLFEIVKTCRKFNLGLLLITQDVQDLLKSNAGNAILSNISYKILLGQQPAVIDDLVRLFQLSNLERTKLLTAGVGEGLIIIENEHSELKVIPSDDEYKLVTTKPDDLIKVNVKPKRTKKQKIVNIKVDEQKGFFSKKELNEDEIKFLTDKGYFISAHVSICEKVQKDYLLKPRFNESLAHFFLIKDIEIYLKKFTKKVYLYETTKPDIVFIAKDKEIAIEVETGETLKKPKRFIENKVKLLNKNYEKNWFFVVTNKYLKKKYEKYYTTYTRFEISEVIDKYIKIGYGQPSISKRRLNRPLITKKHPENKDIFRHNRYPISPIINLSHTKKRNFKKQLGGK